MHCDAGWNRHQCCHVWVYFPLILQQNTLQMYRPCPRRLQSFEFQRIFNSREFSPLMQDIRILERGVGGSFGDQFRSGFTFNLKSHKCFISFNMSLNFSIWKKKHMSKLWSKRRSAMSEPKFTSPVLLKKISIYSLHLLGKTENLYDFLKCYVNS